MREVYPQHTLLDEKSVAVASEPMLVKPSRHIVLEIVTTGFTGTLKIVGSMKDRVPDFGVARGLNNPFEYIEGKDMQDTGTPITGDTGISFTGSTDVRLIEVNSNILAWLGVVTSSVSGGTISVRATQSSN